MLNKTILPLSLKEAQPKILNMLKAATDLGIQEVHLVHVLSTEVSGSNRSKRERILSETAESIQSLGLRCQTHFQTGYVATEVARISKKLGADFITLLWQPKSALRQAVLGNAITDTVRQSDIPVFIYKAPYYKAPALNLQKVMYATDFKATDSRVMNYLINSQFRAETLYLFHVGSRAPDPDAERKRREQVMANLSRLASECAHAYNEVQKMETVGGVKNQIVRQARKLNVELIILGKFDKQMPFANLLGSVAESVPHKSHCSVFIIPGVRQNQ